MTYSAQRETETLNQCDSIVRMIEALEKEIAAGPRLTKASEAERDTALQAMRAIYSNLAAHCRRNLYS